MHFQVPKVPEVERASCEVDQPGDSLAQDLVKLIEILLNVQIQRMRVVEKVDYCQLVGQQIQHFPPEVHGIELSEDDQIQRSLPEVRTGAWVEDEGLVLHLKLVISLLLTFKIMQSTAQVQVSISCRGLKNMDFLLDKSDPYVVVSMANQLSKFAVVGTTQVKYNNLNPDFDKTIRVPYHFEKSQLIRFDVYDKDGPDQASYIGFCVTDMSKMMGADKQTLILQIRDQTSSKTGKLITRCEAIKQSSHVISMSWRGVKLMNTDSWFDFWDKSDPYLKFMKVRRDNSRVAVHLTQVIPNNLNPIWKPIKMDLQLLTGGDPDQQFYIECWDEQQEKAHQYIGQLCLNIKMLENAAKSKAELPLKNPKERRPGSLLCDFLKIQEKNTFIMYLRGGLKINLQVAIDFTGSNQVPTKPTSLHFINPHYPNRYQAALQGVCQILLNYSADSMITAYGFGAILKNDYTRTVRHCFNLSLDPNVESVMGLQSIMNLYANCLPRLDFSGPTFFSHLLKQTMQNCRQMEALNPLHYSVILILTDGAIHDMNQTIDLICTAAKMAISIVIVGIGRGDFQNMDRLDGDNDPLYNSKGQKCLRDIVQFVRFEELANDKDRLRNEVLAEIPRQVQEYYAFKQISPIKQQHLLQALAYQPPPFEMAQIISPMMDVRFQQRNFPPPPHHFPPDVAQRLGIGVQPERRQSEVRMRLECLTAQQRERYFQKMYEFMRMEGLQSQISYPSQFNSSNLVNQGRLKNFMDSQFKSQ